MNTPVALIIFKRPDTTARVFAEIARAKPPKLFLIADGPRPDRPGEAEKCAAVRAIVERVDWKCEVFRNYSDVNLGCGRRPATGIGWALEDVDEAIILEDDCVPHPTFFRFCEELLEMYRNDERVMHIGGADFQFGHKRGPFSYFFSRHNVCFGGWATWRRAWKHHDIGIKLWPELRNTAWLLDILGDPRAGEYWRRIFDRAYAGRGNVDYWDYQWNFACWAQNALALLPNTNLISNIGFGEGATHTRYANGPFGNIPSHEMVFPLQHPSCLVRGKEADQCFIEQYIPRNGPSVYRRFRSRISAVITKFTQKPGVHPFTIDP